MPERESLAVPPNPSPSSPTSIPTPGRTSPSSGKPSSCTSPRPASTRRSGSPPRFFTLLLEHSGAEGWPEWEEPDPDRDARRRRRSPALGRIPRQHRQGAASVLPLAGRQEAFQVRQGHGALPHRIANAIENKLAREGAAYELLESRAHLPDRRPPGHVPSSSESGLPLERRRKEVRLQGEPGTLHRVGRGLRLLRPGGARQSP